MRRPRAQSREHGQRDGQAQGHEQQRERGREVLGDAHQLEAVDGGMEQRRSPDRAAPGLVQTNERHGRDGRDRDRTEADDRAGADDDRHVGRGHERHREQERASHRPARPEPPERVGAPGDLLGEAVVGEKAEEQPQPAAAEFDGSPGGEPEERVHELDRRARQEGEHEGSGRGPAQAEPAGQLVHRRAEHQQRDPRGGDGDRGEPGQPAKPGERARPRRLQRGPDEDEAAQEPRPARAARDHRLGHEVHEQKAAATKSANAVQVAAARTQLNRKYRRRAACQSAGMSAGSQCAMTS